MNYNQSAQNTWYHSRLDYPRDEQDAMREMVRYAALAPSGHNTQCWQFRPGNRTIEILPDFSRRTPVVDPDDHHLHVSLGCAAENLAQAARAFGYVPEMAFDNTSGNITVTLEPAGKHVSQLFKAIPGRQCTRTEFDASPLALAELRLLESAATGPGITPLMCTDESDIERILEYVIQGNTMQIANPDFVDELEQWIRFSDREAIRYGDGLTARTTGSPPVPRWLGKRMFRLFFRAAPESDKYARQIRSSAGLVVFVSENSNPANWIEAGRCYQRFALQATALGIRNSFVNQPVEESALRAQFADALGINGRPDLVVRFGRGPGMPKSLRRPLDDVLV